ncbi:MAG: zinc ribbon domain-containing protein [Blastocatellia bacterium]|nr:zinc ribbon domain-containing protein [Blastocatellia bacterium]
MPIYEYRCKECGAHVEKRQSVAEGPLTECEGCGGKLEKQWSLSGFQFKGEGWYLTDYAGKKSGGEKEGSEKPSSGESTETADTASKKDTETVKAAKTDSGAAKD